MKNRERTELQLLISEALYPGWNAEMLIGSWGKRWVGKDQAITDARHTVEHVSRRLRQAGYRKARRP